MKYIWWSMKQRMKMESGKWKRRSGIVISHGKEMLVTIPIIRTLPV